MRNRPSEQCRDGRCSRQNTQSSEFRYTTQKLSEESRSTDSRTPRRVNTKTDSYFEYVPSVQSNQTQYLSNNGSNYKKPSLPYYVVPVLYVPQKVLSSEEIRPASGPIQNKRTVSFLVKNQSQQSKKDNTERIDVDKIPCISCETRRKLALAKENCDSDEAFLSNVNLDQPYTGYINSSYTPSSTSILEDVDCPNVSGNYSQRKSNNSTFAKYNDKAHEYGRRCKEYTQAYHHYIEQQKRCVGSQNKELSDSVNADTHLRWNAESSCYEKVENAQRLRKRIPEFSEDNTPKRSDHDGCLVSEAPCQSKRASEVYATPHTAAEEFEPDKEYFETSVEKYANPEDYPIYYSYDDLDGFYSDIDEQRKFCDSQTSTLTCEKQPELVGHVASLLGRSLVGAALTKKKTLDVPPEVLTTEPVQDTLGNTTVLKVSHEQREKRRRRRPQESQTMFNDVVIYSTYVATDETIRDTKSTQTVDPGMMNSTTGTQTDRILRAFNSCPPPYMERGRDDVSVNVKPKNREISPSPTRFKRNTSPTKQSIGDVKRAPVIKAVEVTPKSSMNQSIQNYPLRKSKKKKVRGSW